MFDQLRQEINGNSNLSALRDAIRGGVKPVQWSVVDGLILFKGRIFVLPSSDLLLSILESVHGAGHEGVHKTVHRLWADFHVPNDRVVVQDFVRACSVYQRNKSEHMQPGGLLQPLEVASTVWSDVAMDFVEALPKVNGKSVILTVIDRFSKAAHFLALSHPYTAVSVARVFFSEVVRLHGFPTSIIHKLVLACVVSFVRSQSQAPVHFCLSSSIRWSVGGCQQDHCNVLEMSYW